MSKRHTLWALIGAATAGITGFVYWNLKIEDERLFKEAASKFGLPKTKEELRAFWDHARRQRIEDSETALENLAIVRQLEEYVDTSQRLKKAYNALWDTSCSAEVAVWILNDALNRWHKQFRVESGWNDVLTDWLVKRVKQGRETGKLDLLPLPGAP